MQHLFFIQHPQIFVPMQPVQILFIAKFITGSLVEPHAPSITIAFQPGGRMDYAPKHGTPALRKPHPGSPHNCRNRQQARPRTEKSKRIPPPRTAVRPDILPVIAQDGLRNHMHIAPIGLKDQTPVFRDMTFTIPKTYIGRNEIHQSQRQTCRPYQFIYPVTNP